MQKITPLTQLFLLQVSGVWSLPWIFVTWCHVTVVTLVTETRHNVMSVSPVMETNLSWHSSRGWSHWFTKEKMFSYWSIKVSRLLPLAHYWHLLCLRMSLSVTRCNVMSGVTWSQIGKLYTNCRLCVLSFTELLE